MPSASESTATAVNPGTPQEDAGAVAEILSEILDDADVPGVAAFLLALLDSVHRTERRQPRVSRGETFRDVLVGQPLDVKLELFVELVLDAIAAEERSQPQGHGHVSGHGVQSPFRQPASSASSQSAPVALAFRPAR